MRSRSSASKTRGSEARPFPSELWRQPGRVRGRPWPLAACATLLLQLAWASPVLASGGGGGGGGGNGLAPLSTVPVPVPTGGDVVDRAAAVRLGKALFWDTQAGSDGKMACASCHYHAGVDVRTFNSVNPGPSRVFSSGGVTGPGQLFTLGNILTDNRLGSQGVTSATFVGISSDPTSAADVCSQTLDPVFGAFRQVTGRQAPPVIGAVYNRDNFWDGRGNHHFNFLDPFGTSTHPAGGMDDASLASQSVGPALSSVEMSCGGRTFNGPNSLGAKLLARVPLANQVVSSTDGVLGALSSAPGKGLATTYQAMITAAFGSALGSDAVNQFSRIWGEAILAYESTLVPDRTPLDLYLGGSRSALTQQQQNGLDVFQGKGNCTKCHAGPELTDASVSFALANGLLNSDGGDQGFHNLGVRPTAEDLGRAGAGPGGSFSVSGSAFDRGAFKTPALRNVGLTAPYFHNGGKATLLDVVNFYANGGDFANPERSKELQPISLGDADKAALVDFLQNGLTDCRVAMEAAPFDHPSLDVPDGPSLPATGAAGLGSCPTAVTAARLPSDLLWRNGTTDQIYEYAMSGATITSAAPVATVTPEWQIAGRGDFDGDGKADILWYDTTTGLVYEYLMNGASIVSAAPVTTVTTDWKVAGVGDFDGDGKADILWRNAVTNQIYLYTMNGTAIVSASPVATVTADWQIAGVADFDGDGKADILWFNTTTNQAYLYAMSGAAITSAGPIATVPAGWQIAGVGDLDGDGKADILWRHSVTNQVYLYTMSGTTITSAAPVATVTADWQIGGVRDLDGDGKADIVWRNTTSGQVYLYTMSGATITSASPVTTVTTDWELVK